jgi:adenine nucleotide transporter 17
LQRTLNTDPHLFLLQSFLFFFFRSFLIERLKVRKQSSSMPMEKSKGDSSKPRTLSAAEDLLAGMLAGIASRFFTTPLSNVTVRHQTSSTAKAKDESAKGKEKASAPPDSDSDEEGEYSDQPGIIETLRQIVEEKGVAGEYEKIGIM